MSSPVSSIPAVIDTFISMFQGLSEAPEEVYDGLPDTELPLSYAVIGGKIDPVAEGDIDWGSLGGPPRVTYEEYELDCEISVAAYGDDKQALQKTVRDKAFRIYEAFKAAVLADPKLGGIVIYALPGKVALMQTAAEDEENEESGRRADLLFKVRVYNRMQ